MEPNDILIRATRNADGSYSRGVAIAVNDESLLPEMQRTADFLGKCLDVFGRADAAVEYDAAIQYAENLARPSGRILLNH